MFPQVAALAHHAYMRGGRLALFGLKIYEFYTFLKYNLFCDSDFVARFVL